MVFIERMKDADRRRNGLVVKLKVSMRVENCQSDEGSEQRNYNQKAAIKFVNKVRMRDEVVYREFLQIFGQQSDMTRDELFLLLSLRLEKYDDLLEEFLRFLPPLQDPEATTEEEVVNNHRKKRKCPDGRWINDDDKWKIHKWEGVELFAKAKEKLADMDYQQLLGHIYNYAIKKIGRAELKKEIEDILISCPDLLRELKLYLKNFYATSSAKVRRDSPEQDLFEYCSPSYRLLPDDYPLPATTGRREHEKQVLNDEYICQKPSSDDSNKREVEKEDGSRKPPSYYNNCSRDEYKKKMRQLEDDRFEKDMAVSWFKSAVEYAEEELGIRCSENESSQDNEFKGTMSNIRKLHFKRCVRKSYKEGEKALKNFEKRGEEVLPGILEKLKQKLMEVEDEKQKLKNIKNPTFCGM